MALTDEQRAMLQLLLEGGQSYADIGSLLGISPEEVRSRARAALGEIGGADPDAQVPISDYLLGQADPIGRADAVRHLQSDPDANALAERLVAQLRLLSPKAQLPEIPAARGGRRAPAPPPPPPVQVPPTQPSPPATQPAPRGPSIRERLGGAFGGSGPSRRQSQIAVALGASALLVIAVVLAVSGVFGGGDDGDGDGGEECASIDAAQAQQAGIPTIALNAIGPSADLDCPPTGQATLGAIQPQQGQGNQQQTQFALQANAVNLEPTTSDDVYMLWLYTSDDNAIPIGQQTVDPSGNLTGGVQLGPQQVLLLPAFQTIRLARVTAADVQAIQQSLQQQQQGQGNQARNMTPFVGQAVLEGSISELGLDQLLQQAQGQAGGGGGGGGGQAPQSGNDTRG
jgi:hypothetical protein